MGAWPPPRRAAAPPLLAVSIPPPGVRIRARRKSRQNASYVYSRDGEVEIVQAGRGILTRAGVGQGNPSLPRLHDRVSA